MFQCPPLPWTLSSSVALEIQTPAKTVRIVFYSWPPMNDESQWAKENYNHDLAS